MFVILLSKNDEVNIKHWWKAYLKSHIIKIWIILFETPEKLHHWYFYKIAYFLKTKIFFFLFIKIILKAFIFYGVKLQQEKNIIKLTFVLSNKQHPLPCLFNTKVIKMWILKVNQYIFLGHLTLKWLWGY